MGARKRLKPYDAVLEELGIKLEAVEHSKAHYKYVLRFGEHTRFFIVPKSGSDKRAVLNWRSDIRRWLAELKG